MTPEQIQDELEHMKEWASKDHNTRRHMYLESNGAYCFFCGSPDIEAGQMEMDGAAWCEVTCNHCKKTFRDVYHLVDVETDFDEQSADPSL
jgi:hypothetical protein